mgnify:CR=1 FL=1
MSALAPLFRPSPGQRLRSLAMPLSLGLLALLISACQPAPDPSWSGYVEGDYVYISAPVAGTLRALPVQKGQTVPAQTLLFSLDEQPAQAARAEADARLDSARHQAEDSAKGRRLDEIAVTEAQLAQARAQAERAQIELTRNQALVNQSFVSRSRLDDAATAARQAQDRVDELQAALRVARLPARSDAQAAAEASRRAAAQAREQTLWREQQTSQHAPAAGLVADTFFRVGEYVNAGQPVLALLPPERRKARFYVPEDQRGALSPGQAVSLRCDGCGTPIPARISAISPQAEYTPPVIYSNSQRARLVFLVEALPSPADALRLPPGQPLEVRTEGRP